MSIFDDKTSGIGINNVISNSTASHINSGTGTQISDTEVDLSYTDASGHADTLKLFGTSLVFSTGHFTGTITGADLTVAGVHEYSLSGASMDAAAFLLDVGNGDGSSITEALYVGKDTFNLTHANSSGPADSLYGGGGNDTFNFGAKFDADDSVTGGTGNDTILIGGAYANGVHLDGSDADVETVKFAAGHSYNVGHDGASGQVLTIDGSALTASNKFNVGPSGFGEDFGNFTILGGAGKDSLTGGVNNDVISGNGGNDTITGDSGADRMHGGDGNDTIVGSGNDTITGDDGNDTIDVRASGSYTLTGGTGNDKFLLDDGSYKIDGGTGNDSIELYGFNTSWSFSGLTSVETILIGKHQASSLTFTLGNKTVATGRTLTVNGSGGPIMTINGAAVKDGHLVIDGGNGNDTLTGGHQSDVLFGGNGFDHLTGGAGADHFKYTAVGQSSGGNYDTISKFDAKADKLDLWFKVTAVDKAIAKGDFNDLSSLVGAHQLGKHAAVEFTAHSGSEKGEHFLIVDVNGVAGYQPGKDLLIHLDDPVNMTHFVKGDFI